MEQVNQALQSSNGWIIAILIVVIAVLVILGAKNGLLKIKTDKLNIGKEGVTPEAIQQEIQKARALDQKIMDHQKDWAKIAVNAFYRKVPAINEPSNTEAENFRARFLAEKCLNEILNWIIVNHIEDKKPYIELKQELLWNVLLSYTKKEELRSTKFKKDVYDYVEYIIKNLVRIRKQYVDY